MEPSTMQSTHGFGPSPFFYYNPHPKPEHRQHGHFSPHPRGTTSNAQDPRMQRRSFSPMTGHARPASSDAHSRLQGPLPYSGSTTMASPRPICQKPTILVNDDATRPLPLQTTRSDHDLYLFPSTPPLSVSTSAMGSPLSSCGVLSTPGDGRLFVGHDQQQLENVKPKLEPELQSITLAGGDWSWTRSPPLTPLYLQPPSAAASQSSDLLSAHACPSLSPSPSPLPRPSTGASVKAELNFCDPRNLTVSPPAQELTPQTLSLDFPLLPTLCAGDEEEHKLILGEESLLSSKGAPFLGDLSCFGVSGVHGLPAFDELSELDSEEDHLGGGFTHFVPTDAVHFLGAKRQRTEEVPPVHDNPEDDDERHFLSESESDAFDCGKSSTFTSLSTPPHSATSRRGSEDSFFAMPSERDSATSVAYEADLSDAESFLVTFYPLRTAPTHQLASEVHDNETHRQDQSSSSSNHQESSAGQSQESVSSEAVSSAAPPAPISRRGRKQSLTEDPSKTFVCDLCSRRFRRQEHLKRHYRSLHTQDKPFECNECGKKFSRSDNLAQHARTHGSGAIVMGVLESGEMPARDPADSLDEEEVRQLGARLYQAARAAADSTNSSSNAGVSIHDSSSSSPPEMMSPRKKRKRSD